MPGVYREKECPQCGKIHRKRGLFCGQRCSGIGRVQDDATKKKVIASLAEHQKTPQGIANNKVRARRLDAMRNNTEAPVTIEEFTVDIPTIYEIPDGYMPDF